MLSGEEGGYVGTYVVNDLVRDAAVVLQDVVVLAPDGLRDLLGDGQDFVQLVVGNVMQLGAVVLGDDELRVVWSAKALGLGR